MQIDNIKNSIAILSRRGDSYYFYSVNFTIHENDFTLDGYTLNGKICDELQLDGNIISPENLNDMLFVVDGNIKTLISIIEDIEGDIETACQSYDATEEQSQIDEDAMRQELSSPYLTGRI